MRTFLTVLGIVLFSTMLFSAEFIIEWDDNSDNELTFNVYAGTDSINMVKIGFVYFDITQYLVTQTTDTMYYKVTAENVIGESASTNILRVLFKDVTPPAAPTGLRVKQD